MKKTGVIVTKAWLAELEKAANAIMESRPDIREEWLDQLRTSEVSRRAGGVLILPKDHDWAVAFFVWYESDLSPDKEFRE